MYNITKEQYEEVKNQLLEEIEEKNYWSGQINDQFEDGVDYQLNLTVIIYRSKEDGTITDLVPIWWEFHTWENEDSDVEIANDFLFSELHKHMNF